MRVFVIGLPKAGTTSIHYALVQSGFTPAHQKIASLHRAVGSVLYWNLLLGADIFADLHEFDAISQADVCDPSRRLVYWPQMDFNILRAVMAQYPDCRLVLNRRDIDAHVRSISNWGNLRGRMSHSDNPGLPSGFAGHDEAIRRWIVNHYANLEAWGFPYAEVWIDAPDAQAQLSEAVGAEIKWWGLMQPDEI